MDAVRFLQDLTVILLIASAVLILFNKLKQPPVLGYLIAGLIIGPYTPPMPLVKDIHSLEAIAEIGVVFLLFALGIEFHLKRLAKIGIRAFLVASIEAGLLMTVGYFAGLFLGWGLMDRLLLGGVIAVASTAIVARTLLERSKKPAGWQELVAGALIAEDLVAVILIAFFSTASRFGDMNLKAVASTAMEFGMLFTSMLIIGLLVLPRLLRVAERSGVSEVRTMVVIGICFGSALLTEKLGFSPALGAFLAGSMTSMAGSNLKLHETAAPFKDVFGAVFFVSIGMLINPQWLFTHWQLALGLTTLIVVLRFMANFVALNVVGENPSTALQAALVMLPVGELSFVLARLGQRFELASQPIYPLAVTVCLMTTISSSFIEPRIAIDPEKTNRLFPSWLTRLSNQYRMELKLISLPSRASLAWRLIRPSLIQILLNLLGISALFLTIRHLESRLSIFSPWPGALWVLAALLSLPFLIALFRKAHASALILLEAVSTKDSADIMPLQARPLLTRFILGLVASAIVLWYLSLSFSLLPPWPYTLLPLVLITLVGAFLWRGMNKVYSKIQIALRESLAKGEAEPEAAAAAVSHFLAALDPQKIQVAAFILNSPFWACRKSIRETNLRAKTGANILQINRAGEPIPTPDPEVLLQEGDEILLIGEPEQIKKAKTLLEFGS